MSAARPGRGAAPQGLGPQGGRVARVVKGPPPRGNRRASERGVEVNLDIMECREVSSRLFTGATFLNVVCCCGCLFDANYNRTTH